jgi:hypothetical protein
MNLLLQFLLVAGARAAIHNVEVIHQKASNYEIEITGDFKGGSGSFYLVTEDGQKVPCRYDGGLMVEGGLVQGEKCEFVILF